MKRCLLFLIAAFCLHDAATAQSSFDQDERAGWECAYPYSETNCQSVLISYSEDQGIEYRKIFDGFQCSDCETKYVIDLMGYRHVVYSICRQPTGAIFTSKNFVAPIKRYKESSGKPIGWNVLDWDFQGCFQTWECNRECSLNSNPPHCIKMKPTHWGLYVPVVGGICSYGEDGSDDEEDDLGPEEPRDDEQDPPRDDTWTPLY